MKPVVLITNDDGFESGFLRVLAEVLIHHFEVRIAAPKTEQSWIGKAISRRRTVEVCKSDAFPCPAWVIDGTPADCVNIALGNLLKNEKIDAVVSGINIGFNVSLPLVLSSGTVGGALEAALQGYPAIALSQVLAQDQFEKLQSDQSILSDELEGCLRDAAIRSVGFIQRAIAEKDLHQNGVCVHNINFPMGIDENTLVKRCKAAMSRGVSLFELTQQERDSYVFRFTEGENIEPKQKTDLNCLRQGHITYSLFDYSQLSKIDSESDNVEIS